MGEKQKTRIRDHLTLEKDNAKLYCYFLKHMVIWKIYISVSLGEM